MRSILRLRGEKPLNRLLKTAMQEIVVPFEWNKTSRGESFLGRQVEAMNCIKKEQRPNLLIQVGARMTKVFKGLALHEQLIEGCRYAERIQCLISDTLVLCRDNGRQRAHSMFLSPARCSRSRSISISIVMTSSRSSPLSASASCALSRPYFTPTLYR